MYLHFQDWSEFVSDLERREIPHGDSIIKVFASEEDPRAALGRYALKVVESNPLPFYEEAYTYAGDRIFKGQALEQELSDRDLEESARRPVRALFRFANEHGFCQAAMADRFGEDWLFANPFDVIDGIGKHRKLPVRARTIHLDIFSVNSLRVLRQVVDYDDPNQVLSIDEGFDFLMSS